MGLELIERFYPQVTKRPGIAEFGGLISGAQAAHIIGFIPSLRWRGFLG